MKVYSPKYQLYFIVFKKFNIILYLTNYTKIILIKFTVEYVPINHNKILVKRYLELKIVQKYITLFVEIKHQTH